MRTRIDFPSGIGPSFTEEACEQALWNAKWPDGYRCPCCRHSQFYPILNRKRPLYQCQSCRHQTTLIAGTIMEGSRTSLCRWFQAIYWISTGISAVALAARIGVTYKTAWLMNHKLRHAIREFDSHNLLSGHIQVYGDFYGGSPYHSSVYLDPQDQPIIAGAAVDASDHIEYLKLKQADPAAFPTRDFPKQVNQAFIQ